MRFAVHRPGIPVASPRSHGVPRRDIPGRVNVSIVGEVAGYATEEDLALAALRCDEPACRTSLACVCGTNLLNPSWRLILQTPHQQSPSGAMDASVESSFCPDMPTRIFYGALGGAGHSFDVEVLDPDQVEPAHQTGACLLDPVFAPVCLASPELRDSGLYFPAAVRCAIPAGELALQAHQPCGLIRRKARHTEQFSGGQGSRHRHAPVDPGNLPVARRRYHIGNAGESDMPPSSAVTRDPIRLHFSRHGTRPAEPHPARLWDPDLADIAGDSADIPLPAAFTHDTKSLVSPCLSPRREPMRSPEEVRHGLCEVPQCLLLHHLAAVAQPRVFRARCGELSALFQVTWRAIPPRPPVRMLLDRQVPYIPGMGAVLCQDRFLLRSRSHAIPAHTTIIANPERRKRQLWPGRTVRFSPHTA